MPSWKPEQPRQPERSVSETRSPTVPTRSAANKVLPQKDRAELIEADEKSNRGFDPYNSGAFNKRDAWSKVIRK